MTHLILGGARSGKSRYAEQLAIASQQAVTVIVTAQANDDEMALRIAHHQANRPAHWQVVESPFNLAHTLKTHAQDGHCLIVDCLTLWLTNLLCQAPAQLQQEKAALIAALPTLKGTVLLVSNEVGSGIIPMGELTRQFVDEAGWLNQAVASVSEQVTLVVAGLPLGLK
ncbi:MAG: bifunctional adenosylcobinamide kinase/adenosylcobinamide-phosphate guanylyltransferase [Sulfuriferula sp.]|nr:bifunctional adenosylcobinamide kinase/adenosylcobinamide-phosphate guanylyltransferase [Sulfuriferula sp.]